MSAVVAARIIRSILADNPDSSHASEAGDWAETISALRGAYDAQGVEGARKVFGALAKADPGLMELVAVVGEQERKTIWTVGELYDHEFPELRWAVPNMVPEGLSILAGRPKLGKSWLALQMATAVGTGGIVLGERCEKGKVLFLALEDSPRRLKERMVLQQVSRQANIEFHLAWAALDRGGLQQLMMKLLQGYRLVIIDTLSRAVGQVDQLKQGDMTGSLGSLQELALQHSTAVLMIDHHNKSANIIEDPIDAILGATSKAAVIDAGLGLFRGNNTVTLKITGRDFEARDLALDWDKERFCWRNLGDAQIVGRGQVQQAVLDALGELGDATATDISSYISRDISNIRKELLTLVRDGLVIKMSKRGREQPYQLSAHYKSKTEHQQHHNHHNTPTSPTSPTSQESGEKIDIIF